MVRFVAKWRLSLELERSLQCIGQDLDRGNTTLCIGQYSRWTVKTAGLTLALVCCHLTVRQAPLLRRLQRSVNQVRLHRSSTRVDEAHD